MFNKNKILLFIICVIISAVAGFFIYNNFYSGKSNIKGKIITESPVQTVNLNNSSDANDGIKQQEQIVEPVISGNISIFKDIQYATISGVDKKYLSLDLYLPKITQKTPVLVWVHGGGWIEGDKGLRKEAAKVFAERGYAVASINYRLAEKSGNTCPSNTIFPAAIHDVKAAIRWLRANAGKYNLDTDKFGAIGDSSGAHLASLLGVSYGDKYLEGTENSGYSDKIQAVVDWYGPVDVMTSPPAIIFKDDVCTTDLNSLDAKYGGESTEYFYWNRAWSQFLGGGLGDSKIIQQAKLATPLTYIDSSDPPFLIIHGKIDGMIPDAQSKIFADALKKAGIETTYLNLADAGHGFSSSQVEVMSSFLDPTIQFLDKHLKKQSSITPPTSTTLKDIQYAAISGVDKKYLSLDLYLPKDYSSLKTKLPLAIYIHGGGWRNDNKILGSVYAEEAIKNNFAFASLNYRLSQIEKFPAAIHDIKAAIRYLRANAATYNLDANKIGIWGGSAGGHLASLTGVSDDSNYLEGTVGTIGYSSKVQAVVDWFGPTDFSAVIPLKNTYSTYYAAAGQLVGGMNAKLEDNLSAAALANPIAYITGDDPPFLIMHGISDGTVPISQSKSFYSELKKAGVDVTYNEYEKIDHYFPENSVYTDLVFKFFKEKLK